MYQFFKYGCAAGYRARSFQAVLVLGLALVGVAYLAGYFSPRQPQTVALDVGLSGIRFTLILMSLVWVHDLIVREVDRKTILFSLAYPTHRHAFLLGRYGSVVALALVATAVLGLLLVLSVVFSGGGYDQQFPVRLGAELVATLGAIWLDACVIASVGVLVASFSTVTLLPLAVGFVVAVGGKALGPTIGYLARGADGDTALVATYSPILEIVRWVMPDLSLLDWRGWALYGVPPAEGVLGAAVSMAVAYIAAMLLLASSVFARREFS